MPKIVNALHQLYVLINLSIQNAFQSEHTFP